MSEELKPCPFCGGNALSTLDPEKISCDDCGGRMIYYYNLSVDEEWNTRPLEDALLEACRAAFAFVEMHAEREEEPGPVAELRDLLRVTIQKAEA